jgi:Restriction endonuclease
MSSPYVLTPDPARDLLNKLRQDDPVLTNMITARDSLGRVLTHLEQSSSRATLMEEIHEPAGGRRVWQDAGLYYRFSGRLPDAIAVFARLYEKTCEEQGTHEEWLPKGMPLVWMSQCHEEMGHPALGTRFLLLAAVSDAVRDKGELNADSGIYFRARWRHGWTHEELQQFFERCFRTSTRDDKLAGFPEHILLQIGVPFVLPYATPAELDIFEINRVYASSLLKVIAEKEKSDGKDLEKLAAYFLGAIPGFEVRSDLAARDTQYDGLVRNRGVKHDFRADLGTYVLVECKDWSSPVGVSEVSQFINKLVLQDCRGGILFSSSGISGQDKGCDAELQLLKAHYRAGKIIIVLSEDDFRQAAEGRNLVMMLREKYERIRFDLSKDK